MISKAKGMWHRRSAYHVLRTIADQPASQLDELLPWNWRKTDITAAAA